MAKVATSILKTIRKYVEELEKNQIHIKSAIIFGSYAKGNHNEWSDLDVALVSDDFEGIRFNDRQKIARITLDVDYRISPLTFKTEDFTEEDLFAQEIMKTGIKII